MVAGSSFPPLFLWLSPAKCRWIAFMTSSLWRIVVISDFMTAMAVALAPSLLFMLLLLLLLLGQPPFVVVYWPLMMLLQPLHIMRASSLLLLPQNLLLLHLLIPLFSLSQVASSHPPSPGYGHLLLRLPTSTSEAYCRTPGSGIRISSHFVLGGCPTSLTLRVAAVADNKG